MPKIREDIIRNSYRKSGIAAMPGDAVRLSRGKAEVIKRRNRTEDEASTILYRLLDPHGATVEVGTCTIAEAGTKAARFIEAQASEGLAGSIEFSGSGLKRRV